MIDLAFFDWILCLEFIVYLTILFGAIVFDKGLKPETLILNGPYISKAT